MEKYNEFGYGYMLANQLFGIEMDPVDFEEVGLIAWNLIGNRRTRIYQTILNVDCEDGSVELPCNLDLIEAVTRCGEDY
jgi:hypothetical protein